MQGVFESFFPFYRTLKPELGVHIHIGTCDSLLRDLDFIRSRTGEFHSRSSLGNCLSNLTSTQSATCLSIYF